MLEDWRAAVTGSAALALAQGTRHAAEWVTPATRALALFVRPAADAKASPATLLTRRTALARAARAAKRSGLAFRLADIPVGKPKAGAIRAATDTGRHAALFATRTSLGSGKPSRTATAGRPARARRLGDNTAMPCQGTQHESDDSSRNAPSVWGAGQHAGKGIESVGIHGGSPSSRCNARKKSIATGQRCLER